MTTHAMFDGRLQLYKRAAGHYWKDVAEEWYLGLRGKLRNGMIVPDERTFRQAAEDYLREVRVLAATVRSPTYVQLRELRVKRHILPFFGDKPLSAVNRGLVQAYRVKRAEEMIERTKTADQP